MRRKITQNVSGAASIIEQAVTDDRTMVIGGKSGLPLAKLRLGHLEPRH